MFGGDLGHRAGEWALAGQPLVDHDSQRILIAGRARRGLNLLRRHIGNCANDFLILIARAVRGNSDAKIREQHGAALVQQHILRLDVPMDQLLLVGILEGIGHLFHIATHRLQRHLLAPPMARAQRALGGIGHHQIRLAILNIVIQHAHNVGVLQAGDGSGLALKARILAGGQFGVQHFNRRWRA